MAIVAGTFTRRYYYIIYYAAMGHVTCFLSVPRRYNG